MAEIVCENKERQLCLDIGSIERSKYVGIRNALHVRTHRMHPAKMVIVPSMLSIVSDKSDHQRRQVRG
ncbi:hypothetical protein DPMN_108511 [Dreissena polymorpha]|uniref:Uncharacterized protein n=1 Tax=Dreissena polymorpha TaxID=45954 RepID=A0A9D4K8Z6_DREPO|nr:hypothetical protein DPMN_108511 [Dreissena polymorpha]